MMGIKQLGYIGLEVSGFNAWEKLASEVLGFEVIKDEDRNVMYLRMDAYHHRIVLHEGQSNDLAYVGWQVNTREELDGFVSKLGSSGVPVTEVSAEDAQLRKVLKACRFRDPHDHLTEIFYGPLVVTERPFHPGRPFGGFLAGGLGLGHVVLSAPNPEAMVAFYRDLLGFRVSDYIDLSVLKEGLEAVFLHCNQRHHSLAFVNLVLPKRLQHFMVETRTLDDVGMALDLCLQREIPLSATLGRHSNDKMVSFYLQSPSGFSIEYGCNGILVDDEIWVVEKHVVPSYWGHKAGGRFLDPG